MGKVAIDVTNDELQVKLRGYRDLDPKELVTEAGQKSVCGWCLKRSNH